MKLNIFYGGFDDENIASFKSIKKVSKLLSNEHISTNIYIDDNNFQNLNFNDFYKADFFFFLVHGKYAEDGTLSILFKNFKNNLPSFESCQLCYNKFNSKSFLAENNINVTPFLLYCGQSYQYFSLILGPKLVFKPIKGGSSINVFICENEQQFLNIPKKKFKTLVEKYIHGTEFQVAIIKKNNEYLTSIGEIQCSFYTFDLKYDNEQHFSVFPNLSNDNENKLINLAITIFELCKLTKFARIDFLIENNEIYFNEINTIPGLGKNSIFVKLFEKIGFSHSQLLNLIIDISEKK